jgi:xanthine dehydrogenase YagS FAD-binding subunit
VQAPPRPRDRSEWRLHGHRGVKPLNYVRPTDERAAIAARAGSDALIIAGETGVVDLLRLGVEGPSELVDLNGMGWSAIERTPGGGLRVGALVKNTDLAYHPDVLMRYPVLSQAILAGASPQLRNRASVGGILSQRTRCACFRDAGSDPCVAAHPSDMCVALAILDAVVHARGPQGERAIRFADFHLAPGDRPDVETALAKGEVITGVELPALPLAARSIYVKVRDRASYSFALASAAVAIDVQSGAVRDARVALGGVATKPWRSREAEEALRGQPATKAVFERTALAALDGAVPRGGNEFKVDLVRRVIVRALEMAGAPS